MKDYFEDISKRYGLNPEALQAIWDKTECSDTKLRVKKFLLHLTQITGSDRHSPEFLELNKEKIEEIARVMLYKDIQELKELA